MEMNPKSTSKLPALRTKILRLQEEYYNRLRKESPIDSELQFDIEGSMVWGIVVGISNTYPIPCLEVALEGMQTQVLDVEVGNPNSLYRVVRVIKPARKKL